MTSIRLKAKPMTSIRLKATANAPHELALLVSTSTSTSTASILCKGQQMAETLRGKPEAAGYGTDASNRKAGRLSEAFGQCGLRGMALRSTVQGAKVLTVACLHVASALVVRLALKAENSHDQPPSMCQHRSLS